MSHVAKTATTQTAFPWQATLRTTLQTIAGIILFLVAFVGSLATFAPQFLDAIKDILPPEWLPYLAAAVAFIGALSGALARIMAIPGVNDWLTRFKLGASPEAEHSTPIVPFDGV